MGIKFKTTETKKLNITLKSNTTQSTVDSIRIETPEYAVNIPNEMPKEDVKDKDLVITIEESQTSLSSSSASIYQSTHYLAAAAAKGKEYKVTASKSELNTNGSFCIQRKARHIGHNCTF